MNAYLHWGKQLVGEIISFDSLLSLTQEYVSEMFATDVNKTALPYTNTKNIYKSNAIKLFSEAYVQPNSNKNDCNKSSLEYIMMLL